jgi:hypothetical protein
MAILLAWASAISPEARVDHRRPVADGQEGKQRDQLEFLAELSRNSNRSWDVKYYLAVSTKIRVLSVCKPTKYFTNL